MPCACAWVGHAAGAARQDTSVCCMPRREVKPHDEAKGMRGENISLQGTLLYLRVASDVEDFSGVEISHQGLLCACVRMHPDRPIITRTHEP